MRADAARAARGATVHSPLARATRVAALVTVADMLAKVAAVELLHGRTLPLGGALHLTTVYNDTFARGIELGMLTAPAACLLAMAVIALTWRVCTPLAQLDAAAPVALGLVAGAALGNAADFLRTGRGAVDFVGVHTADGAIVFNLADVAAYAGALLLARTAFLLVRAIARREAPTAPAPAARPAAARSGRRERPIEVAVPVPSYARADAPPAPPPVEVPDGVRLPGSPRAPQPPRVPAVHERGRDDVGR